MIATSDLVLLALNHAQPEKEQPEVSGWFSAQERVQEDSQVARDAETGSRMVTSKKRGI
jgi:hypothetical protein